MAKAEEKITQMYDAQLKNQKAQLQKDNDAANANLDKAQRENQKATDASLNRVAVEAQKDMMNDAEYYAASGLSSGARAQARLSRSNQQAADMTALRQAGLEADAEAERQRALLAKEYAAAITQAQAENDLKKAQALYEQAQLEEQRLLQKQLAEEETRQAEIKAQSDLEKAALEARLKAAEHYGDQNGDYKYYYQLLGFTDDDGKPIGLIKETENTTLFRNMVMTPNEFRQDRSEGKEGTYKDYLLATLERWHAAKKISDNELAWLMNYYKV